MLTINSSISDLFFMVDNSHYWNGVEENPEDATQYLLDQAETFCDTIRDLGHEVDPQDLVNDFLDRV